MRMLTIDIGEGTQDILVYDKSLENSYRLTVPSPTHYFANEVRKTKEDLIIYGKQMGGGSFAKAIREHQKKYKVYMTEEAAKTIRNDLDKVRNQGIELISEAEINRYPGHKMKIGDLEIEKTYELLKNAYIDPTFDVIGVAVQDHGHSKKEKHDRECRFEMFEEKLKTSRKLESFAYLDHVPEEFSRMHSVLESVKENYDGPVILMDTGPAAALGIKEDERAKGSIIAMNIGNLHTIAFSLRDDEICGMFEHHTALVDETKLWNLELKLCRAELGFKEVYEDGGHGAISIEKNIPEITLITGPNRQKLKGLVEKSTMYRYALGEDHMFAGCIGLVKATQYLLK
ncbi:MAG: DUF1786 domain-containing protein [Candidatus Aenigmarchaeota archaeon]|nr:DUF1786 domain-containing protein [Candidatus Aenigmarchaeota archaeon]